VDKSELPEVARRFAKTGSIVLLNVMLLHWRFFKEIIITAKILKRIPRILVKIERILEDPSENR
jgi:hypothetical protein